MLHLLWCLKRTVVFTLRFTELPTKFRLRMVLFHNRHTDKKSTANPAAKRRRATGGLTALFCVPPQCWDVNSLMMTKCFPCPFIKKHQAFCIAMILCSVQIAHAGRRKYLSMKATDGKAEQSYLDRRGDWKHTWVNRILSLLQRC